ELVTGPSQHSLLAKVDASETAGERGQPCPAVNILHAFQNEVDAQSGKSFSAETGRVLIGQSSRVLSEWPPDPC
ncbi:MAG: hypothetical protein ABR600_11525, partial [Actinomycetota bacterium]